MTYKNRNGKEFSERLVKLARMSPKPYADIIRDRNTALLRQLEEADTMEGFGACKYVAMPFVEIGCPHCSCDHDFNFMCGACLWTEAGFGSESGCLYAVFPSGHSLMNVSSGACSVQYCCDNAYIYGNKKDMEAYAATRAKCQAFLEDHVDWAGLECWGEECKEQA